jgi:predicted DNA-binding transcriptional regulator AlpA
MQRETPRDITASLRHFDALPDAAHVRQRTVQSLFGISPATVWRWVNSGALPKPHKHGPRVTAWNVGELRAVLHRKAA